MFTRKKNESDQSFLMCLISAHSLRCGVLFVCSCTSPFWASSRIVDTKKKAPFPLSYLSLLGGCSNFCSFTLVLMLLLLHLVMYTISHTQSTSHRTRYSSHSTHNTMPSFVALAVALSVSLLPAAEEDRNVEVCMQLQCRQQVWTQRHQTGTVEDL